MSRFISLLSQFGLENRLIAENSNVSAVDYIDFTLLRNRLAELKEKAMFFLYKSLK